MDEYYSLDNFDQEKIKSNCSDLQTIFQQPTPTAFTDWIRKTLEFEDIMKAHSLDTFDYLFRSILHGYHTLLYKHENLQDEWIRMKCIAETCWKLDEEIGKDESAKKLSHVKVMFKRVLVEAFNEITIIWDRIFIISWARKMYYHVYQFSSPYKHDHFIDLLKEVINIVPEGI